MRSGADIPVCPRIPAQTGMSAPLWCDCLCRRRIRPLSSLSLLVVSSVLCVRFRCALEPAVSAVSWKAHEWRTLPPGTACSSVAASRSPGCVCTEPPSPPRLHKLTVPLLEGRRRPGWPQRWSVVVWGRHSCLPAHTRADRNVRATLVGLPLSQTHSPSLDPVATCRQFRSPRSLPMRSGARGLRGKLEGA
jgi:hypothetical protein